jgi:hypothetical protein
LVRIVSSALNRTKLGMFLDWHVDVLKVASMSTSDPSVRAIIELNIAYYRNLLKDEVHASNWPTIAKLVAEEEAELAKLLAQRTKDK